MGRPRARFAGVAHSSGARHAGRHRGRRAIGSFGSDGSFDLVREPTIAYSGAFFSVRRPTATSG